MSSRPIRPAGPQISARTSGLGWLFAALVLILLAYDYAGGMIVPVVGAFGSRVALIAAAAACGTLAGYFLLRRSGQVNRQLKYYVDELHKVKDALETREEMYRSLVESTGDSIYVVDRETRYVYVNKQHRERMGLSEEDYRQQEYGRFHYPEEAKAFRDQVEEVFRTGVPQQYEHKSQRDDRYFLRTCSPVRDGGGAIFAVTVVSTDITRLKDLETSLRSLSLTDSLTGLYNRRGLFTVAEQQLKLVGRMEKRFCVLYVDLDNLKVINDQLGHQTGDDAIMTTARLLRETFRESDTIARIGGDEFIVLIVTDDPCSTDVLRRRLQAAVDGRNRRGSSSYALSLSSGIAAYDPAQPKSLEALILEADQRMYEDKRSKK
jgi:diguanylate cyclase (GGDEF)-like protein/PAS domain S-box-containing protein